MQIDPQQFSAAWLAAWNAHDVEAVLAHFAEDATFASPLAMHLFPDSAGQLVGKAAIRAYWQAGLARVPDLHFTLLGVYAGIDSIVIRFANQAETEACEVLRFDGELVIQGWANYTAA